MLQKRERETYRDCHLFNISTFAYFMLFCCSQGLKSHPLAQHSERVRRGRCDCPGHSVWTCDQRAGAQGQEPGFHRDGRRDLRNVNGVLLHSNSAPDARPHGLRAVF